MKLKFGNNFLVKTQNTIISAALVLAITSLLNAFLGFVKSRLLASYFGVSADLAVFYTADRIPNLIYSLLIVGAVSTVFIPVFSDQLKKNKEGAFETASSMINITITLFIILGTLIFILSKPIIGILSVGRFSPEEMVLGSNLMRIMLLSQLILVFGSLATSILQSFKYFIIPALAPVLYNIGMILGIVLFADQFGIYGPAIGVFMGALMHFFIQLPLLKIAGFSFKPTINLKDSSLLKLITLVPPRLLSVLLSNLVATINNSLAILISTSAVVYLKFGIQLQTFPVSLFGLSIASASLPTLAQESDKDQCDRFKKTFITSLHQMLYFVIPSSVMLLVLRVPMVRIVYGVSNFPWEATIKTAYVLAFFSLSVPAQSLNYLLTRSFYALKDTLTPVKISLATIFLNVILSLTFVTYLKLGVWSVALAFSITSYIDAAALFYLLNKKVGKFDIKSILVPFTKISYAAVLMGITLYLPMKLMDRVIFDTTRTMDLLLLTGTAALSGMATYFLITSIFKVEEVRLFYKLLRKLNLIKVQKPTLLDSEKEI